MCYIQQKVDNNNILLYKVYYSSINFLVNKYQNTKKIIISVTRH